MSAHGSNFTNLLKKMRSASIVSHGSVGDEGENPFQNNYTLSNSPAQPAGGAPRFSMSWGDPAKTPRNINKETITEDAEEEDEEEDFGPSFSPSASRKQQLPVRSK
jgi:hypothetical protein